MFLFLLYSIFFIQLTAFPPYLSFIECTYFKLLNYSSLKKSQYEQSEVYFEIFFLHIWANTECLIRRLFGGIHLYVRKYELEYTGYWLKKKKKKAKIQHFYQTKFLKGYCICKVMMKSHNMKQVYELKQLT